MRFSPTRLFVAEAGCLWPFRSDVNPPPEPENPKMRRGKAIHADIEQALIVGDDARTPEGKAAVQWHRDRGDARVLTEFCMGVNLQTGKAQPFANREAIPADGWMPVIVDLVVLPGANVDTAEVWDWKTGSPFSTFDYGPQVRANGYAVASHLGKDEVVTGLAYVSVEGVKAKNWVLDEFDLADQRRKLRMWVAEAPQAQPTRCSACKYCPAKGICPEGQK